ncbi:MAG TPA: hypothetical protein VFP81_06695, partial [Propionibacteriaceae bacterium]|nr:hypothetical protein [Propionibacteriaceae bacterium]
SFQPASVLSLDRVRVVRDVEAASGGAPILVVDGNARPVGWADPERPGRVIRLGSTFSPETDTLRAALDSALTSPHGLAVAVRAETGRYAGVVSADTILAKVKDVRASVAESIAIREAEARAYELLAEPEHGPEPVGAPEEAYESTEVYDQLADHAQGDESDQVYDQLAEPEQAYESTELYDQLADQQPYESDRVPDQQADSEQAYQSGQVPDQQAEPEQADESGQVPGLQAEPEPAYESEQVYNLPADAEQADESGQAHKSRQVPGLQAVTQPAYESEQVYNQPAEPEQSHEANHVHEQRAQPEHSHEWDQVYDQLTAPEPVSHADLDEISAKGLQGDVAPSPQFDAQGGEGIDSLADLDYLEEDSELAPDGELLVEDRRIPYEQDEGRTANGEASHRRGSGVLQ